MEALAGYGSSGSDEGGKESAPPTSSSSGGGKRGAKSGSGPAPTTKLQPKLLHRPVIAAPSVGGYSTALVTSSNPLDPRAGGLGRMVGGSIKGGQGGAQDLVLHNPRADVLLAPIHGPAHPHKKDIAVPAGGVKTHTAGVMMKANVEDWSFHEQYHTFHNYGYAMGAGQGMMVGNEAGYKARDGDTVYSASAGDLKRERKRRKREEEDKKQLREERRRRKEDGGVEESKGGEGAEEGTKAGGGEGDDSDMDAEEDHVGDEDVDGVWAPDHHKRVQTDVEKGELTEEQEKYRANYEEEKKAKNKDFDMDEFTDRRDERKLGHLLPPRHNRETDATKATSTFHGKAETDYQGRSWVQPPSGMRPGDATHQNFPPQRCIHKWTGHSKGVQAIRFSPGYGHLLLSASMDSKIKIWDVYSDRGVRRTYKGHSAAVRDVTFNNDGSRFVSASYDRFSRLWDTETGQCVSVFTNRKMPYCVTFYPRDDNIFLAGCSDNKIIQWDARSGEITQEYNHHLSPVNSVLFVDDDERFVSTSDDKKVLIWEYDIPVPIKYISEPEMHSMPATALHPSGGFWVGQSLDNRILTWGARDKFRENKKKVFKGHTNAGYACRMDFSPSGKFLASGDGTGKLFVWDWNSKKVVKSLKAHDKGPAIDVKWHPKEPSWVATCGWDGLIKLWR